MCSVSGLGQTKRAVLCAKIFSARVHGNRACQPLPRDAAHCSLFGSTPWMQLPTTSEFENPTDVQDVDEWEVADFTSDHSLKMAVDNVLGVDEPDAMPPAKDLVEGLSGLIANDEFISGLMQRSEVAFESLVRLLETAASSVPDDRAALEQIRATASETFSAATTEPMYLLLGGLVSAGKTTLVNALIQLMLPELEHELRKSPGLLPSDYNENTRVVTEILCVRDAQDVTIKLMTARASTQIDEVSGKDLTKIMMTSKTEFCVADGFPKS
mmetsp:Transcript_77899/g.154472  ORF Transcript_77899/g.154472 Transcript_77899/m.154472 type:complete len:270 (-) Transcript_77899:8-817(-)